VEEEKILALGFCSFCRHCVDEFITDTPSLDFHLIWSSTPQSKSDRADLLHYLSLSLSLPSIYLFLSLTAISDYRMSVSCQREERSDYLFPTFAEWCDTAVEVAFRFVSSYDGFREINRKVG